MPPMIRAFRALRPLPDQAQAVVAPPYDVVSTDEARAMAASSPSSFLHISRPEIDLPAGTGPYSEEAYARGAQNLSALISGNILERDVRPAFYAYRMTQGGHSQTGVALLASVRAYEAHQVKRHELTRPDKEADRVRNIDALNAQTGPVLCAYRAHAQLDAALSAVTEEPPFLAATGQHDVEHEIWRIDEPEARTRFEQ